MQIQKGIRVMCKGKGQTNFLETARDHQCHCLRCRHLQDERGEGSCADTSMLVPQRTFLVVVSRCGAVTIMACGF